VRFLAPLLVALSVAATAAAQQQTASQLTDIYALTVNRMGSFGGGPIFAVTFRRQGISTYISSGGLLSATRSLLASDFDQLAKRARRSSIPRSPGVVGRSVEDAEKVVVSVRTDRQSKAVMTYDLATAPASFIAVVTLADGLAAKHSWENLNEPKNGILGPFPLRQVEQQYTEEARKAGLRGSAIVRVEVRPDGTVAADGITIIQGLGMGLDEKAIESVKQWIFKPAYKDGKPAGITMPVGVQVESRL
jgi:TonB family protein